MRLHLSDLKLKDSVFSWKLNEYNFKITYNFPTDDRFLPILRLSPIIQLSCLISSLKSVATATTDFELNLSEKIFLREHIRQLQPVNINYLGTAESNMRFPYSFTVNDEDFTGSEYSHPYKQYRELNISEPLVYEDTVISSWSGGKDSLLTIMILKEIGCTVLPGTTKWNTIAFNRGAAPYMEAHEIKPVYVASIALGNKMKKLTLEVIRSEKLNDEVEIKLKDDFKGDVALPMVLYHPFYMQVQLVNNLAYALHKKVRYIFAGDEHGVNDTYLFGNHMINHMGQSFLGKKLINSYIGTFYNQAPTVNSVLYPLYAEAEVNLLVNRYNRKDFTSCLTMINKHCNRCVKCALAFLVLQGIGENPEDFGLNKKKLIKEFKKIDKSSLMLPSRGELAWLIKRNLHDTTIKKITDNIAEGVTEDTMLNPLIPVKEEYKSIPKAYRKQITNIYNIPII